MRVRRGVLLIAAIAVVLTGCSSAAGKLTVPDHARAYFFGDSWTHGYSATPGHSFVDLTVRHFGWTLVRSPDGSGSGFVHSYPGTAGDFPLRAAKLPKHIDANLVVIEGGINDVGFSLTGYSTAVDDTISLLRKRVGAVPVVLLGPPPLTFPVNASEQNVDRLLRAAAVRDHALYISPLREEWITASNVGRIIDPKTGHPDNPGHAYLASRLERDIVRLEAH